MNVDALLSASQQQQIREIGIAEYEDGEKESCGFLLSNGEIYPCENKSQTPQEEFIIEATLYTKIEKETGIIAIWHSHANGNGKFTAADVDLVNRTQKPLILYDVHHNELKAIDPSGNTPLLDRTFVYGIYDCFSLVRDYYKQEKEIEIPNYPRSSDDPVWDKSDWEWIDTEYEKVGFKPVEQPEVGDVIAMSLGANALGINHLAIYLGEDKFIHQLNDRVSKVELWGHPWSEYTIKFLRYFGLNNHG